MPSLFGGVHKPFAPIPLLRMLRLQTDSQKAPRAPRLQLMNLRLFALLLSLSPNAQAGDVPSSPGVAPISSSDPRLDPQRAARGYVGAAVCGDCHQTEFELWQARITSWR